MSFGSVSSSSSMPRNLGVGNTQSAYKVKNANAVAIKLLPGDQTTLDRHLKVLSRLNEKKELRPTKEELQALSNYTEELITNPARHDVVQYLKGARDIPGLHYYSHLYGDFISMAREKHVEFGQIAQKLQIGKIPLTYEECRLIDLLTPDSIFAEVMFDVGITDNPHINNIRNIAIFAKKNAFKDFKDGDVLFYDMAGRMSYSGDSYGFLAKTVVSALGTKYTHVGVFFRDQMGRPCVAEIQAGYTQTFLKFGQMSYIKGKRIDPAQFTATTLTPEQRDAAQKRLGGLFARNVQGNSADKGRHWKLGITDAQQLYCVFGHTLSNPTTKLGQTKIKDGENVLCSEFVALGLMQSFDEYNKEMKILRAEKEKLLENPFDDEYNAAMRSQVAQEFPDLSSPFSEYEYMAHVHPERVLDYFGPHKDNVKVDSGWQDVADFVDIEALLPIAPGFPDLSYAKRDLDPAGHHVKKVPVAKPKAPEAASVQSATIPPTKQNPRVSATGLDDVQIIIGDDDVKKKAESDKTHL